MELRIDDPELAALVERGIFFHGHLCPAMPLGIRAGLLALETLGASRSQDKELFVLSETAEGHAMACFLDGVMMATGCTYGKGNCRKLRYGKMAFTLVDKRAGRKVRVSLNPDFVLEALSSSPFIAKRKEGIPPQEIEPELAKATVEKVLSLPEEKVFLVSGPTEYQVKEGKGTFEAYRCASCGEAVYARWVRVKDGKFYCIPCSGYGG